MRNAMYALNFALILAMLSFIGPARGAEPTTTPLLLANFDFETPDAVGVWRETNARDIKPSVITLDTNNPHSGKAALKYQTTAAGKSSRFLFTGIPLPAEHPNRVRVRFYARTAGTEAKDAEIDLLERDAKKVLGWCGGKPALVTLDAGSDWKEFSVEVPVNPEARMLTLMVRINNPAPGKTVWIDDLSLEFVEAPSL